METSRKNPQQLDYYRKATDLIGFFGVFHQKLVEEKVLTFADYSPSTFYLYSSPDVVDGVHGLPHIRKYAVNCSRSLNKAWELFMQLQGSPDSIDRMPSNLRKFNHPYIKNLIPDTFQTGMNRGSLVLSDMDTSLSSMIKDAFANATQVSAQLCAIFGAEFNPQYPVLTSRIHLANLAALRRRMGLTEVPYLYEYSLLDSKEGLDRKILRTFGRGSAIGCPASQPMTEEARIVLFDISGVDVRKEVMLKRYARDMYADFVQDLQTFFDRFDEDERKLLFTKHERLLLSGKIWQTVKENPERVVNGQMIASMVG